MPHLRAALIYNIEIDQREDFCRIVDVLDVVCSSLPHVNYWLAMRTTKAEALVTTMFGATIVRLPKGILYRNVTAILGAADSVTIGFDEEKEEEDDEVEGQEMSHGCRS